MPVGRRRSLPPDTPVEARTAREPFSPSSWLRNRPLASGSGTTPLTLMIWGCHRVRRRRRNADERLGHGLHPHRKSAPQRGLAARRRARAGRKRAGKGLHAIGTDTDVYLGLCEHHAVTGGTDTARSCISVPHNTFPCRGCCCLRAAPDTLGLMPDHTGRTCDR